MSGPGSHHESNWLPAPSPPPALGPGQVHIWRIGLTVPHEVREKLVPVLATDERDRAERYGRPELRERFTVCRAAQRLILAQYLSASPAQLQFVYEPRGKPSLAPPWQALQFNLANSKDLALLAVAHCQPLGVDLEQIRHIRDLTGMAAHYFAESECQVLQRLAGGAQQRAFFTAWTRKEALLKAVGCGLTFPLHDIEVSLSDQDACEVRRFGPQGTNLDWKLQHLEPGPGYVGALALRGTAPQICCWSWTCQG